MTDLEDRILALRGEISVLLDEIERLSEAVIPTCTHRYTVGYGWMSDDGYGRVVPRVGKRCQSCGYIDWWGTGKWEEGFHKD